MDPQEAVTSKGQAVVTLRAGTQSGTAEVVAFSGSARTETPITIQIGGAAAAAVTVTANPAIVPWTGWTVTIAASVSDAAGNRLNGVPVSFSTTAGTLAMSQVTTDATGLASTTLNTNVAATVTATVSGTVAVCISPAPTIAVTPTTGAPTVGGTTVFSVVTSVAPGGNPISSVTVDFGDGASASLGSLTGTTSVSTSIHPPSYQVIGTVVDSTGQGVTASAVITVVAAIPLNVNLTASPSPGTVNEVVTFTATTTGTTVAIASYAWNFGDGTIVTTSGNIVNHVYTTSDTRTVTVTATTTEGVTDSTQITLIVVPLQVEILLTASPVNLSAGFPVTFTATVTPATVVVTRYDWLLGDGTPLLVNGGQRRPDRCPRICCRSD